MMITDRSIARPIVSTDRVLTLQGGWEQFKLIQKGCATTKGARLFYFDGTIDILMPGLLHENFASVIGWMLTYFLLTQKQVQFTPTRSMTQERAGVSSAQADESYCIGDRKSVPDLSIEVLFTSGGVQKLEVYRALAVPEVWFWEDGVLRLYHLRSEGYQEIQQSELPELADLDLDLLKRCILMAETDSKEAMMTFVRSIGYLE
jgi:Uma2 family endonuclease